MKSQGNWAPRNEKTRQLTAMAVGCSLIISNEREIKHTRVVPNRILVRHFKCVNGGGTELAMQGKPEVRKSQFAASEASLC